MSIPAARDRRRSLRFRSAGVMALMATGALGACTHHHVPANDVTVVLRNGAIDINNPIKAGRNTVHMSNTGTVEHEVIFIKADSATALPTAADGSVDEDKLPKGAAIGEAELEAGASATKTFTFTKGKWVAVCNVVSDGHIHFATGMWKEFTVG
jgi:hypothetical protein